MGSDLSIYIAQGPDVITLSHAEEMCLATQGYLLTQAMRDAISVWSRFNNTYKEQLAVNDIFDESFEICASNLGILSCSWESFSSAVATSMSKEDFCDFLSSFMRFWNDPIARDTTWCHSVHNPAVKIVVAGETTWGDAPSGFGYAMLSQLLAFSFSTFFGVDC